jgi:hypothetical protein
VVAIEPDWAVPWMDVFEQDVTEEDKQNVLAAAFPGMNPIPTELEVLFAMFQYYIENPARRENLDAIYTFAVPIIGTEEKEEEIRNELRERQQTYNITLTNDPNEIYWDRSEDKFFKYSLAANDGQGGFVLLDPEYFIDLKQIITGFRNKEFAISYPLQFIVSELESDRVSQSLTGRPNDISIGTVIDTTEGKIFAV